MDNTALHTSICNYGPKDITDIYLHAFISKRFKTAAWCKSETYNEIKIGEQFDFILTEEFEKDVDSRFGGLRYDKGWRFKNVQQNYKITLVLRYQPIIAETDYVIKKNHYSIKPVIENNTIKTWEIEWIGNLHARLFWFCGR